MSASRQLKVGVALGGGSARGWAHIGVLQALEKHGIKPEVVAGTSIGALVGASYACGQLEELRKWVSTLTWQQVVGFLDPSFSGGLIAGKKLFEFFKRHIDVEKIEQLSLPYGAVATDLETGQEVWLQSGSVLQAIRASVALPGLFTPLQDQHRWLLDGGLVNPVPVSLCRALGAELVIAVDLNSDLLKKHRIASESRSEDLIVASKPPKDLASFSDLRDFLHHQVLQLKANLMPDDGTASPSLIDVVLRSLNIMQTRITRSRMAGDPPELLIAPRLSDIQLMEFHRAEEAIDEGRRAVERVSEELDSLRKLIHKTDGAT